MSSNTTVIKRADWCRIQGLAKTLQATIKKENVRVRVNRNGKKRYEIPLALF